MKKLLNGTSMLAAMAGLAQAMAELKPTRNPNNYGRMPKRVGPRKTSSGSMTPANLRAAARLKAHREIWANTPTSDRMTRQRRRRLDMGRI